MIARLRRLAAAIAVLASIAAPDAGAHEIPADVRLNALIRPAGNRLELLIRVPMAALIEVEFPLRGNYLDMAKVDQALRSAAKLYLTDNITVYENDVALPPRVADLRVSLPSDKSFAAFETARACAGATAGR